MCTTGLQISRKGDGGEGEGRNGECQGVEGGEGGGKRCSKFRLRELELNEDGDFHFKF